MIPLLSMAIGSGSPILLSMIALHHAQTTGSRLLAGFINNDDIAMGQISSGPLSLVRENIPETIHTHLCVLSHLSHSPPS